MRIDNNTIIKCESSIEVIKCLDMLKDLGFDTFYEENDYELFVVFTVNNMFTNFETVEVAPKNNLISFKTFQKLYNKQIEEKQPNLLIDKNGKVLKINNDDLNSTIYSYNNIAQGILGFPLELLAAKNIDVSKMDCYISREACEKAEKRNIIRRKLEALAFELNGNRDITEEEWKNTDINKYYLCYLLLYNSIDLAFNLETKKQGTIFCLSKDFEDKAIELIGEEDLEDYLINY